MLLMLLLPTIPVAPVFSLVFLAVSAAFVYLNSRFYAFLSHRLGVVFALRAVPLHWLYFLYSCAGFGVGLLGHLLASPSARHVPRRAPRRGTVL